MSRPSPPVEYVSATLPKLGNRAEENEDAVAAAPDGLRFAIADGASEGWESGAWAARLGSAFVRRPPAPTDFPQWLAELREAWAPAAVAQSAPWYASVKQAQGSFATLLGLEFRLSGAGSNWTWKAVAVGDTCALYIRGEELKASFPLASVKEFGSRPALVSSSVAAPCPAPEWLAGYADPGDLFLMASDAAAARLLDPKALAPALAAARESLKTRDSGPLLAWCREVQSAINDDVSVIAIRLTSTQEPQ
jgi:hypothetical protein